MTNPLPGQTTLDQSLLGSRDAIHSPVVLATSYNYLSAGDRVVFVGGYKRVEATYLPNQGVVDPFIKGQIEPGTLFWVYLAPGMVEGFGHTFKLAGDQPNDPPDEYCPLELDEDDWCRREGC